MERTDYDTVFNCPVCLSPKQGMVFGLCQHFVCADCLYDAAELSLLKPFSSCPICKAKNVFPEERPDIPDTTRQLMEILGVVKCGRKLCGEEMWTWEKEQHDSACHGISRRATGRRDASPSSSRKVDTRTTKRLRSMNNGSNKVN